jgi:hypothetical protein
MPDKKDNTTVKAGIGMVFPFVIVIAVLTVALVGVKK